MVMEVGQSMSGARWTSNSPHPFRRSPGGGVGDFASTRWTSTRPTPFGPAPGAGVGGFHDSGFAADPVNQEISFDDEAIIADWKINVTKEPVAAGMIPSMVLRFLITDRGTATKAVFDKQIHDLLKKAGFKVSIATSLKAYPVTWKWKATEEGQEFYYPVVATPAQWAGIRYAGEAMSGESTVYQPTVEKLQQLPAQLYVYTMAVTSQRDTMTDGDGAQVVTIVKQGRINMAPGTYAQIAATVRGCPASIFKKSIKPPLKVGIVSSLILLAAYNLVSYHVGSERL